MLYVLFRFSQNRPTKSCGKVPKTYYFKASYWLKEEMPVTLQLVGIFDSSPLKG